MLGSPNMSSRLFCSDRETKAAANAVMVGSTKMPLERTQRDRLPIQRREVEPDRMRSGRTNSAATTVANNPKITSAGINPASLPGSGSGIVGAAADSSARNDNPGITTRTQNRCLGMTQSLPAFTSADHAEFGYSEILPNRPGTSRFELSQDVRRAFEVATRVGRMPEVQPG